VLSLSEMSGLNSIVTVPFTHVWSTLYGPLVLASSLRESNAFSLSIVQEGNCTIFFSGFLICDFHLLNVRGYFPG
jgi:hypothetical protein